jgi:hypothetical protein
LDETGTALPNWPAPVSGIAFGSPELFSARISGARNPQLFAAFVTQAGELTVYTETAQALPGFPLTLAGVFYLQPVFDGEYLWIIESGGTLYRISLDGHALSHTIPRLSVREEGFIKANAGEIFVTGAGNALHGYTRTFNSLDGFPLPVWGRPFIGDLYGDKSRVVAGVGMDNRLYIWQFR